MKTNNTKFRVLFILLLIVLMPHTAWWFSQFESTEVGLFGVKWGVVFSWIGAFAFEGAIYAFTEKLSEHIGSAGSSTKWFTRIRKRYFNIYTIGLALTCAVSIMANKSHALVFGEGSPVFTILNITPEQGSVLAGGILPICSLLFAWVLSTDRDTEQVENEELMQANSKIRELNKTVRELNQKMQAANQFAFLGSANKTEVITEANRLWPELNNTALQVISEASKSHVSTTLASNKNGKAKIK